MLSVPFAVFTKVLPKSGPPITKLAKSVSPSESPISCSNSTVTAVFQGVEVTNGTSWH